MSIPLMLASYYSMGGDLFGNMLFQWEQAGVFSYVLPFLVLFALTYGILSKINIFGEKSKGINVVISLAASLMSLQFGLVSVFFSEIFPRMGVGLGIMLVFIVIVGLAFPSNSKVANWFLVAFFFIIFIVILWNTFGAVGWNFGSGYWNYNSINWGNVILVAVVIFGLVAIIVPDLFKKKEIKDPGTLWQSILGNALTPK